MDETTELLRRHAGLIHKIAYAYCRDRSDREDLVQEVCVQLWRAHGDYDPRFRETTWVYRIALNVAISFYRRERRHKHTVDIDDHAIAIEPDLPNAAMQELFACIDDLGPLDRALVILYLEDNDHTQIAEILGITVSNVGTKLGRIKHKLRAAHERKHGAR
jgi:RNA polymerase sigma factor (sigma-70 family)